MRNVNCCACLQVDGVEMQSDEGTEWLTELLTDVQLQQYFLRIRDDLNVTRLSHFDYVKNEDLEKIGMGRPGEWGWADRHLSNARIQPTSQLVRSICLLLKGQFTQE